MTSKLAVGMVSVALAIVGLVPLAGAAFWDDTLSRTFPYVAGTSITTSTWPKGVGWYDSDYPEVCGLDWTGGPVPAGGDSYYETARTYTNLPGFVEPVTTPGLSMAWSCPIFINPRCTQYTDCAIHIAPMIVGPLARTIIPQDGQVCTQQSSFVVCIPTASKWTINACPWTKASFKTRSPGYSKGVVAGLGFEGAIFSQDIDCAYLGANYVNAGYDVSFYLGNFDGGSNGNLISSGFAGVSANLLVPYGNGIDDTAYVVSCLQVTYTTLDTAFVPPIVSSYTEDGVDWALILDLDSPSIGWLGPLEYHLEGTNWFPSIALQGIYDLGGQNNCDFAGTTALPQCANGTDDSDPDLLRDVVDPNCYSVGLGGVSYYNPFNSE